ncbi:MAG: alpha/beta hydrolase [Methylobacter sp.]|nr:alpha/beta hydrolase [Methylobacter sp.]
MTWKYATATIVGALMVGFVWLQPVSVSFLKYLIWACSASTKTEKGSIEFRGAHIHYVAYGQGEPVLLLHGGLSNKLSWFAQIPWLVASGRRVVLIDTRGHGDSTLGDAELNYHVFADDTLQVLNRLGIQRADIIGWSDGGIIALILGREAPERVGRIVAISANFQPSALQFSAAEAHDQARSTFKNKIIAWLQNWWSGADKNDGFLVEKINALWQSAPQLEHSDLKAIVAPTLVVAGEYDVIDPDHTIELARNLTNGKLEIVMGAGHTAHITHATKVNPLIAAFLNIPRPI